MPEVDWFLAVAAIVAALAVGMSKGGLPIVGMLSVPILALVMSPVRAAAVLLPIYIISDMVGLWLYRRDFSPRNLAILIPAGVAGVGIGWATATVISDRAVTLLIGFVALAFCIDLWRKRKRTIPPKPADVPRGLLWGVLTGFTSFVSHAGAPPYQMYMLPQKLPKLVFAGTSTILFTVINLAKLGPYWALGQMSPQNLQFFWLLVPAAIVGTYAGRSLVNRIPQELFYRFVQGALFVISLKLIFDGIRG